MEIQKHIKKEQSSSLFELGFKDKLAAQAVDKVIQEVKKALDDPKPDALMLLGNILGFAQGHVQKWVEERLKQMSSSTTSLGKGVEVTTYIEEALKKRYHEHYKALYDFLILVQKQGRESPTPHHKFSKPLSSSPTIEQKELHEMVDKEKKHILEKCIRKGTHENGPDIVAWCHYRKDFPKDDKGNYDFRFLLFLDPKYMQKLVPLLRYANFESCNLSGMDLSPWDLTGANLGISILEGTILPEKIENADMKWANLKGAKPSSKPAIRSSTDKEPVFTEYAQTGLEGWLVKKKVNITHAQFSKNENIKDKEVAKNAAFVDNYIPSSPENTISIEEIKEGEESREEQIENKLVQGLTAPVLTEQPKREKDSEPPVKSTAIPTPNQKRVESPKKKENFWGGIADKIKSKIDELGSEKKKEKTPISPPTKATVPPVKSTTKLTSTEKKKEGNQEAKTISRPSSPKTTPNDSPKNGTPNSTPPSSKRNSREIEGEKVKSLSRSNSKEKLGKSIKDLRNAKEEKRKSGEVQQSRSRSNSLGSDGEWIMIDQ